MYLMTRNTTIAHCFMFPDKRSLMLLMAFKTRLIDIIHGRGAPWPGFLPMRAVAIGTAHLAFQHRMPVRHMELGFFLSMAAKTDGRVLLRVDDIILAPRFLSMNAARAMTDLTALSRTLDLVIGNTCMGGDPELLMLLFMTGCTGLCPYIGRFLKQLLETLLFC
jgi:hypothetical protein